MVLCLPLAAKELKLEIEGTVAPILVSLPKNHDPAKSWPAVFSYHGTGGEPNTYSIRHHTGPDDWIVVGMSYTERGAYKLTPDGIAKNLAIFHHVRDELARSQGLDPERVYLAGFSKGGWMTDTLLQADASIAGGAILMGGHIPTPIQNPPAIRKTTQVFIGVGRLDPNHLGSLKALVFYRELGLATSFEAWPDLGHAFPRHGSLGLHEWFTLRKGGKPDHEALEAEFTGYLKLPPIQAWHALIEFKERPFCTTEASPWPDKIHAALKQLEHDPLVAHEAKIRSSHRQLLSRELKMRTLEELRRIDADYMRLEGDCNGSAQVDEILHDHRRILAVLKETEAAARKKADSVPAPVKPTPPEDERIIPRNPLVR
jgi:predicted esterase